MTTLTKDEIRIIVCEVDVEERKKFMDSFPTEMERFIEECHKTWIDYDKLSSIVGDNERKAYVVKYVLTAIDNLMISGNLLVSSYFTASGNMFRQMLEAILMAVILGHNKLDKNYFEEYISSGTDFRVNKVFDIIENNHENIKFEIEDWNKLKNLRNHLHKFSHASLVALSTTHHISKAGVSIIGSEYDEGKREAYRKELELRISAWGFTSNLIVYIKQLAAQL